MEQLNRRIRAWLWPPDLPAVLWRRNLLIVAHFVYALVRELASGELSLRAMSLVYTTMLAIVPLLALSFSILKGLGFHRRTMEPVRPPPVPGGPGSPRRRFSKFSGI